MLSGSFSPGALSDPAAHVDCERPNPADRAGDVFRSQPAGEDDWTSDVIRYDAPVEGLACPAPQRVVMGIEQQRPGIDITRRRLHDIGPDAHAYRLHVRLSHPGAQLRRLLAVELQQVHRQLVDHGFDLARRRVHEHPDNRDQRRQCLAYRTRLRAGDEPRARLVEHQTDRVCSYPRRRTRMLRGE